MKDQNETPLTERKVVRRGLLAGLAGLGAAAMLKFNGAGRAEAEHAADDGVFHVGVRNDGGAGTDLDTATSLTTNTTLVANVSGGGNASLRIFNIGAGGAAIDAKGGNVGGDGIRGTGGIMSGASGDDDGRGVVAIGGSATEDDVQGGIGVDATGGTSQTATGGKGIVAKGGGSTSHIGGTGVDATGGFSSQARSGDGVIGRGGGGTIPGEGVIGIAGGNANGVRGATSSTVNSGVAGHNLGLGPGVRGASGGNGTGVKGVSNTGNNLSADGTGSGIGVHGKSSSGLGVRGDSVSAPGVHGESVHSLGVRGISTNFTAMVGISTNGHGLYGSTSHAGSAGFVGENLAGGLAGYFAGNVFITGSLNVAGAKNAVIKMQDGTLGSVYCQESPEPYFEDFGRGQLTGGVANVALEREFTTLVAGGDYMVFTHPEGDTRGLFVSRRGPTGFEVREVQGGTGSVPFTYRIVTKRKDIEGRRFARVTDTVAPGLAAARAAMGVTGAPPVNNAPPNPVTPPPFVPQPNPALGPIAPSPQPQNNGVPGANPNLPGFIIPPAGSAP